MNCERGQRWCLGWEEFVRGPDGQVGGGERGDPAVEPASQLDWLQCQRLKHCGNLSAAFCVIVFMV